MEKVKLAEDDDAKEIIAELEGEEDHHDGDETPEEYADDDQDETGTDQQDPDEQEADDDEASDDETDDDDTVDEDTTDDDTEDDDQDDEVEDLEDEPEVADKSKKSRKSMPIGKFKKFKEKRDQREAQLLSQIEELKAGQSEKELDAQVGKLTEKYPDADPNFIKDIIQTVQAGVAVPKAALDKLNELAQDTQEQKAQQRFNDDFEATVLPLMRKQLGGEPTPAEISQVKNKLQEIVSSGDIVAPIKMIYLGNPKLKPKRKRGAEPSRPSNTHTRTIDVKQMEEDEELGDLPDDEFDKVVEQLDKRRGSTQVRVLNPLK